MRELLLIHIQRLHCQFFVKVNVANSKIWPKMYSFFSGSSPGNIVANKIPPSQGQWQKKGHFSPRSRARKPHQMTIPKRGGGAEEEDKPRQVAIAQFEKVTCQHTRTNLADDKLRLDQEIWSSISTPLHILPAAMVCAGSATFAYYMF